jgi:hypothetical protein
MTKMTSRVLRDSPESDVLLQMCALVFDEGGSFTIHHERCGSEWFTEYNITRFEDEDEPDVDLTDLAVDNVETQELMTKLKTCRRDPPGNP